jgi:hypothetical protein
MQAFDTDLLCLAQFLEHVQRSFLGLFGQLTGRAGTGVPNQQKLAACVQTHKLLLAVID